MTKQVQKVEQVEGGGIVTSGVYIPPTPGGNAPAQAAAEPAAVLCDDDAGAAAGLAAKEQAYAEQAVEAVGGEAEPQQADGDDLSKLEEAWLKGEGQRPLVRGSKVAAKGRRSRTLAEAGITRRHLAVGAGAGLIAAAIAVALLGNAMAGLPQIPDRQVGDEGGAFTEATTFYPVAESELGVEITRSTGAETGESGPYYVLEVTNLSGKSVALAAGSWEAGGQPVEAWLDCTAESGQTVETELVFACAEAPATAKGSIIIYEKGGLPENPLEVVEAKI